MGELLSEVNLGANIKAVRKQRGLSIKALAETISVSASLLSQIERGLANPSIATISAISSALNEPLYNFFLPRITSDSIMISRAATRKKYSVLPDHKDDPFAKLRPIGYECERLSVGDAGGLEVLRVKLPPHSSNRPAPNQHNDVEIVYIESGIVQIQLGTEFESLGPHDSVTIPPQTPHRWINESDEAVYMLTSTIQSPA